ncbi:MAG: hypothetical protein ACOX8X_03300 [Methanomethylophilus sp.]|jgi:hypothetical protein
MPDTVCVVEAIADGAEGYPYDEILSIAVCRVDLDAGEFDSVFDANIAADPKDIGKRKLDYAESKGLDVIQLYDGVPIFEAAAGFKAAVKGQYVTSYDIREEFTKYLTNDPWDITFETHVMPSIMVRQPISLRCKRPEDEPDYIRKAYSRMFRNSDPADVGMDTKGALALAQMAAQILIELRNRGKY